MTITYPLSLPASCKSQGFSISLLHATEASASDFTFEDNSFQWPGERWEITFTPPPIRDRELAAEWFTFAAKLRGVYGTFLAGDPLGANPRGAGGGTPLVDGADQTGYYLDIKGAPTSTTGWLLKGDYLQVGTGSSARLHMLTANADTDGSGLVTVELAPALAPNIADNTVITIVNAVGVFRMTDKAVSRSQEIGGVYRYGFSARSVV